MDIITFTVGAVLGAFGGIGSALCLLRGASDLPDCSCQDNLPDDEYRRLMEIQDRTGYDTGVRPRKGEMDGLVADYQCPDCAGLMYTVAKMSDPPIYEACCYDCGVLYRRRETGSARRPLPREYERNGKEGRP